MPTCDKSIMTGAQYRKRYEVLPESRDTWAECFERYKIAEHLREGLERYLVAGIEPGAFLCAVIDNDLRGAIKRAGPESVDSIEPIMDLLYNEAPAPACDRATWV